MSQEEAYRILGISHYATMEEIKKAYRILCKQCHPDKNASPEALQKYLQVQNAYEWIVKMGWYRTTNTVSNSAKPGQTGKIIGDPSLSKQYRDLQIRTAQTRRDSTPSPFSRKRQGKSHIYLLTRLTTLDAELIADS